MPTDVYEVLENVQEFTFGGFEGYTCKASDLILMSVAGGCDGKVSFFVVNKC